MPTKKIADHPQICTHPDHKPPMHQVFEPGIYEHTCAGCGHKTKFTVPLITNSVSFGGSEYDDESSDYIKGSQEEY